MTEPPETPETTSAESAEAVVVSGPTKPEQILKGSSRKLKATATKVAPWRKGISWVIVLIEGIVAALIGVFVLWRGDIAGQWAVALIGAYFLITGLVHGYAAYRSSPEDTARPFHLIRNAIASIAGLLAVLSPWVGFVSTGWAATLLVLAMIGASGIDLFGMFATRDPDGAIRWGAVIAEAASLALALMLAYILVTGEGAAALRILGWVALIIGVLLIVYGLILRRQRR